MTATSDGFMFSMPAETRCTIDCTWSGLRLAPGEVSTNTDAVGSAVSETKTLCFGRARWTDALVTPWIEEIVLASSPSIARW